MALAHPGSLLDVTSAGRTLSRRLADGLDHRAEAVHRLPGVDQFLLGPHLPLHHPVKLGYLVRRSFLMRLLEALLVSLAGETLFDKHGGEDLFAWCADVVWA